MVVHRSPLWFMFEEGRVPRVRGFFHAKGYRFVAEIISTIRVANAIINDNASYTLMLITSLSRGKPNTSNYLMEFSIPDLLPGFKEKPLFVIHKAIPSLSNRLW